MFLGQHKGFRIWLRLKEIEFIWVEYSRMLTIWTALFRAAPGRWLIRGWFHCYGCLDCSMQAVQPEWLQSWWGCDGDLWHSWWWLRPSQWTPPVSSWSWQHLSPLHLARSPSEHHMLMGAARADKLADHHHELVDVLTLKPTILIKPYKTNLVI